MNHFVLKVLGAAAAVLLCAVAGAAPIIWWGGLGEDLLMTKANFADCTLPANQDRITSNVWLTRDDLAGLFNIKSESEYVNSFSPADTEWAFSSLNGNGAFAYGAGAANYASLTFDNWGHALEGDVLGGGPGVYIVDRPGVVHLITDDIYIDIEFTSWAKGTGPGAGQVTAGGGFSYVRATPEPATMTLVAAGALGVLGFIRRRRTK